MKIDVWKNDVIDFCREGIGNLPITFFQIKC